MARRKKATRYKTIVMRKRRRPQKRGGVEFVADYGATRRHHKKNSVARARHGFDIHGLGKTGLAVAAFMFLQSMLLWVFQSFNLNVPKVQIVVPLIIYWMANRGHLSFVNGIAGAAVVQFWNTLIMTTPSLQKLFQMMTPGTTPTSGYQFLPSYGAHPAPMTRQQRIQSMQMLMDRNHPQPATAISGYTQ